MNLFIGLCPGLYTPKELPLICNQLLPASHRMRTNGYGQIEDRFFQRIKQNLHVLICIKDDERLSTILNKYPILIHKVACIDVYKEWSRDFLFRFARSALQDDGSTATTFLDHVVPSGMDINAFISKISTVMAQIHVTSRCFLKESSNEKSLYTPQKFDEFVQLFINLCRERVQKIQVSQNFYHSFAIYIHFSLSIYSIIIHLLCTFYTLAIHFIFTCKTLSIHLLYTCYSLVIHLLYLHLLYTCYTFAIHLLYTYYILPKHYFVLNFVSVTITFLSFFTF